MRRTILLLLLGLAALEVLTRVALFDVSKDISWFRAYPARARELAAFDGLRIAVVGNSITHEDIDTAILARALESPTHPRVRVGIFHADHSFVNAWQYILTRFFWRPGNDLDLVLIPFWGENLRDGNGIEVARLAYFFTTFADWPEVLSADLDTGSARADFIVSSFWATFAVRERMREFVFTRFVPGYRSYTVHENAMLIDHFMRTEPPRVHPGSKLHALVRLLDTARRHGTRLCFVAVPTLQHRWSGSHADLVALIEGAGMSYVDLRDMPGIDDGSFKDEVHMTKPAREYFSRRLGAVLAPLLPAPR